MNYRSRKPASLPLLIPHPIYIWIIYWIDLWITTFLFLYCLRCKVINIFMSFFSSVCLLSLFVLFIHTPVLEFTFGFFCRFLKRQTLVGRNTYFTSFLLPGDFEEFHGWFVRVTSLNCEEAKRKKCLSLFLFWKVCSSLFKQLCTNILRKTHL